MAAVKQDGEALKYVKKQTPELCIEAVRQNGWALKWVQDRTPELCMAAVQQDGWALQFVKNQTPELCIAARQSIVRANCRQHDEMIRVLAATLNCDVAHSVMEFVEGKWFTS